MNSDPESSDAFKRQVRVRTIRSFAVFFVLLGLAFAGYRWIITQPKSDRAYSPLRTVMNMNAKIFARDLSDPRPVREFPKEVATRRVRVNGRLGLAAVDSAWALKIVRYSELSPNKPDTLFIGMEDIRSFPKTEVVFNFKCIEGWSQVTWWGGVRFSDFAKKYGIGTRDNSVPDLRQPDKILRYCGLSTPDGGYYVGIDMASMMHPQTILCYEMNGKPLLPAHGAPLRLIIPVKYGIKHIKQIGKMFFSDEQPPDYWGVRGYDYFAGL